MSLKSTICVKFLKYGSAELGLPTAIMSEFNNCQVIENDYCCLYTLDDDAAKRAFKILTDNLDKAFYEVLCQKSQ